MDRNKGIPINYTFNQFFCTTDQSQRPREYSYPKSEPPSLISSSKDRLNRATSSCSIDYEYEEMRDKSVRYTVENLNCKFLFILFLYINAMIF